MHTVRKNKKDELIAATVRLVANGGSGAATIRAIAHEAGVTDAAVYRHYRSKDEFYQRAYASTATAEDMIREKEQLVANPAPIRQKLHEWIRLSYAYFDNYPEGFTYVFLTPHTRPTAERDTVMRQGQLFIGMIRRAQEAGDIRPLAPQLALSHFVGLMLNVPRLINAGMLDGPASAYTEEVSVAVWRTLRPDDA
jgi:AcrR family transcriptional regulator